MDAEKEQAEKVAKLKAAMEAAHKNLSLYPLDTLPGYPAAVRRSMAAEKAYWAALRGR